MDRYRSGSRRLRAVLALFLLSAAAASALPRVAALPLANKSGDPRLDYIGAIVEGLLQYDLSSSGEVELVDRASLDAALKERELSLSALAAEPSRLGAEKIESADFLLSGDYVLIGKEIVFTLRLIEVATTRTASFSEGGSTENAVHALAERVVERLSGKRVSFRGGKQGRSLLSLRDETPGSIALHSPLIDAEILLDGSFAGYTTGDRRVPFIIEGLEPGPHTLSTDLGKDFGVVSLPEIAFAPWSATVEVPAGKRVVVTDESRHFNDTLYRLRDLLSESVSAGPGPFSGERRFSFVDRGGVERSGSIAAELTLSGAGTEGAGRVVFSYGGERRERAVSFGPGAPAELKEDFGLVALTFSAESRYGDSRIGYDAERLDVRQGMHRARD